MYLRKMSRANSHYLNISLYFKVECTNLKKLIEYATTIINILHAMEKNRLFHFKIKKNNKTVIIL